MKMTVLAFEVNRAFGEKLRSTRDKAGLSQAELASRSSTGRTTIANMEIGGQAATVFQLFALAQALGVTPADLLPDLPSTTSSDDIQRLLLRRQAILSQV